ncbi:MAG: peptidoglycan DD-metalloendopeptidase family protein [Oricola sp.]
MRRNFTSPEMFRLLRAATILSIGGLVAGCSSDAVRFSDGFYTGAIPTQAEARAQSPQTYGQPNYDPGADQTTTGSISPQPVQRTMLPRPSDAKSPVPHPVASVQPVAAPVGTPAYGAPANVSPITTSSIAPAQERFGSAAPQATARSEATSKEGWSTAGATQVTMREGETVYNLAKRYGVPANAIMEANGISDPKSVLPGQRLLIPTYVYSRTAGVSTPDRNPSTIAASSSIGNRNSAAMAKAPAPQLRPVGQTVASASAPARAAVIEAGGRYTVVASDTLSGIARRTGASVGAIKQVNSMSTDTVRLGQKLIIPGLSASEPSQVAMAKNIDPMTTGSVKPAATAPNGVTGYTPPSQAAKTTEGSITKIETQASVKAPEATGVSAMRWPVQGRVINAFGSNNGGKPNDGIDISVPNGTPVKAAENGVVIYAGDGLKELGKTILVRHSDGLVTVYGHVSGIDVKRGETVKRGQQIAASGMSGAAKQPQLHFEVRKNSTPVNPATYLN